MFFKVGFCEKAYSDSISRRAASLFLLCTRKTEHVRHGVRTGHFRGRPHRTAGHHARRCAASPLHDRRARQTDRHGVLFFRRKSHGLRDVPAADGLSSRIPRRENRLSRNRSGIRLGRGRSRETRAGFGRSRRNREASAG